MTTALRLTTPAKGGGLRGAIAFEWTKLWSVRSTWWSLAAGVLLCAVFAAVIGMSVEASEKNGFDVARPAPHLAAQGIMLVQLAVLVMATLATTAEYANGSIRATLRGVPVRGRMLLAKTAVVAAVAAAAGTVFCVLGTLVTAVFAGEHGAYTAGELAAAAFGTGVYLALIAVLVIGTGTVFRSAAGTITTIIMVLLVLPELVKVTGVGWLETAGEYTPSVAGAVLMTRAGEPYGGGTALPVLLLWAAAAVAGGWAALRARDA
ncbi:ABC transporter permease [Actinocorallia populi]|uniref:ABC transporter permease n=1 Tax=Actinocorallia populi TaxID=2079200 RepID=UPI0018E555DE|nr:ABC transporter permease [Actinocorallia populi]